VKNRKLKAALEDPAICRRTYGTDMAKKIQHRLAVLAAAESLADFWPPKRLPERCHELKGDLAGTFSMDLKHPKRLLFVPASPQPERPSDLVKGTALQQSADKETSADIEQTDELQRWQAIKAIEIVGIEDTHG